MQSSISRLGITLLEVIVVHVIIGIIVMALLLPSIQHTWSPFESHGLLKQL